MEEATVLMLYKQKRSLHKVDKIIVFLGHYSKRF